MEAGGALDCDGHRSAPPARHGDRCNTADVAPGQADAVTTVGHAAGGQARRAWGVAEVVVWTTTGAAALAVVGRRSGRRSLFREFRSTAL